MNQNDAEISRDYGWPTPLYCESIADAFYHTLDYLNLEAQNGIVLNIGEFQFCQEDVNFVGLRLATDDVASQETTLTAIKKFPSCVFLHPLLVICKCLTGWKLESDPVKWRLWLYMIWWWFGCDILRFASSCWSGDETYMTLVTMVEKGFLTRHHLWCTISVIRWKFSAGCRLQIMAWYIWTTESRYIGPTTNVCFNVCT